MDCLPMGTISKRVLDYRILESPTPLGLQKQVMARMADGYELSGGLVSMAASYGDNYLSQRDNIAQAVVLYLDDTD